MLSLRQLQAQPRQRKRRVGRGNGSGRGTFSGRGIKGQKARSGGRAGLKLMGLKATFKAIPKAQGFTSAYRKLHITTVGVLETKYSANSVVRLGGYKVLGQGELTKALTVRADAFSRSAKEKIEQSGGQAILCRPS